MRNKKRKIYGVGVNEYEGVVRSQGETILYGLYIIKILLESTIGIIIKYTKKQDLKKIHYLNYPFV